MEISSILLALIDIRLGVRILALVLLEVGLVRFLMIGHTHLLRYQIILHVISHALMHGSLLVVVLFHGHLCSMGKLLEHLVIHYLVCIPKRVLLNLLIDILLLAQETHLVELILVVHGCLLVVIER